MKNKLSLYTSLTACVSIIAYVVALSVIRIAPPSKTGEILPIGLVMRLLAFMILGYMSIAPARLMAPKNPKHTVVHIPLLVSSFVLGALFFSNHFFDLQNSYFQRVTLTMSLLFLAGNMLGMTTIPIFNKDTKTKLYLSVWTCAILVVILESVHKQLLLLSLHSQVVPLLLPATYILFAIIGALSILMISENIAHFHFCIVFVMETVLLTSYCVYVLFMAYDNFHNGMLRGFAYMLNIRYPGINCALFCIAGEFLATSIIKLRMVSANKQA